MSDHHLCPQCGWHIHRSRSRGLREKAIRTFSGYKAYRCHECSWRGWFRDGKDAKRLTGRRHALHIVLSLMAIILAILVALFAAWDR